MTSETISNTSSSSSSSSSSGCSRKMKSRKSSWVVLCEESVRSQAGDPARRFGQRRAHPPDVGVNSCKRSPPSVCIVRRVENKCVSHVQQLPPPPLTLPPPGFSKPGMRSGGASADRFSQLWWCCTWTCTVREGWIGQGDGQVSDSAPSLSQVQFPGVPVLFRAWLKDQGITKLDVLGIVAGHQGQWC